MGGILWLLILISIAPVSFGFNMPCLGDLPPAIVAVIDTEVSAYSLCSTTITHIIIKKVGSQYFAIAYYNAATRHPPGGGQLTAFRMLPETDVLHFFDMLQSAPKQSKSYKPYVDRTDYYPKSLIVAKINNDQYCFYSESQGNNLSPWGLHLNGKEYVINAGDPDIAAGIIDSIIEPHALQTLCERKGPTLNSDLDPLTPVLHNDIVYSANYGYIAGAKQPGGIVDMRDTSTGQIIQRVQLYTDKLDKTGNERLIFIKQIALESNMLSVIDELNRQYQIPLFTDSSAINLNDYRKRVRNSVSMKIFEKGYF